MKKLSLVLTAMFASCFVFSQNVSILQQTGDENHATISQIGSNTSTVLQETLLNAKNNNATISQNGSGNTEYTKQHQQAGITAAQNAFVTQVGNNDAATQIQGISYTGYNNATINQAGNSDIANQFQDGYNMDAIITQGGGDGNNGSQVQKGSYEQATLNQNGWSNIASQSQNGLNNSATIAQTGNSNQAYQVQNGGDYYVPPRDGHTSSIIQLGNGNYASQDINGTDANQTALIQEGSGTVAVETVNGNYNVSNIYQTSGNVNMNQDGDHNVVKGLGADVWARFSGSNLLINQDGNTNLLEVLSTSPGASANIGQVGNNNTGPDVILLDIQMPEMNGFEVCTKLKQEKRMKEIPIILFTSYAMPGHKKKAIESGADGYIEKPVNPDVFVSQVESIIKSFKAGFRF